MQRKILFVHGFGVGKDSRGMFSEISNALTAQGVTPVLVELNEKYEEGNIYVNSLSEQAQILKEAYERECRDGSFVDMICHSQGCIVATLADLDTRKTIFLAPPTENDPEKTINYFSRNQESVVDVEQTSRFVRRDGTATFVPARYWEDRASLDYGALYRKYISSHETIVVTALNDEVVSNKFVTDTFVSAKTIPLSADHNFTGTARIELISLVKEILG